MVVVDGVLGGACRGAAAGEEDGRVTVVGLVGDLGLQPLGDVDEPLERFLVVGE